MVILRYMNPDILMSTGKQEPATAPSRGVYESSGKGIGFRVWHCRATDF